MDLTHSHPPPGGSGPGGSAFIGSFGDIAPPSSSANIGDVHDLLMERAPSPARMAYTSEKHPRSTFSELNLIRKHHELSDVILTVGNRKIFAHKVILAACSPYFRAMFTGEAVKTIDFVD